jgi:hypothetical protein
MTVTGLFQIYGTRVTRLELYEWIFAHPNHKWYHMIQHLITDDYNKETHLEMLREDDLSDGYDDIDADMIYLLTSGKDNIVQIYCITHDISNDVVVGTKVASISYESGPIESGPVDVDSVLPWLPDTPTDLDEEEVFMMDRYCKYYMVQDDCSCCS